MHNTYPIPQRFLSQKILKYEFRFISPTEQDNQVIPSYVDRLRNMLLPGTFSSMFFSTSLKKYVLKWESSPNFFGFKKKKSLKAPPSYLVLLKVLPPFAAPSNLPHFPFFKTALFLGWSIGSSYPIIRGAEPYLAIGISYKWKYLKSGPIGKLMEILMENHWGYFLLNESNKSKQNKKLIAFKKHN